MTIWTDFVKDWAAKNNMTYGCAISKPQIKIDYKRFKEQNKAPTKKQGKVEAKERSSMSQQDKNVAIPRRKTSASELKQATELRGMSQQDRNVAIPRSKINVDQEIEEEEEIYFIPKKKVVKKKETPKSSVEKIKVNGTNLINKILDKVKELINNSKLSQSEYNKQQSDLLEKIDNIVNKMLEKQDNSTDDQLIDILGEQITKLTEIYKRLSKIKKPREEAKSTPKKEAKSELINTQDTAKKYIMLYVDQYQKKLDQLNKYKNKTDFIKSEISDYNNLIELYLEKLKKIRNPSNEIIEKIKFENEQIIDMYEKKMQDLFSKSPSLSKPEFAEKKRELMKKMGIARKDLKTKSKSKSISKEESEILNIYEDILSKIDTTLSDTFQTNIKKK